MQNESLLPLSSKKLGRHLIVLDGFRGLAIILVILYHYLPFFSVGWVGVDLFFLLSGFLITGKLIESLNQKYYYRQFYTLVHFWSLSCEMQYYLLWPIVVKWLYTTPRIFIFTLLGIIAAALIF